mmetsp:Transcript_27928/g.39453  ORF Transcript_27928/g.39453 Transcript_27928/m.39453 type:complete len:215 (+) Transcript_27928:42-686(+)
MVQTPRSTELRVFKPSPEQEHVGSAVPFWQNSLNREPKFIFPNRHGAITGRSCVKLDFQRKGIATIRVNSTVWTSKECWRILTRLREAVSYFCMLVLITQQGVTQLKNNGNKSQQSSNKKAILCSLTPPIRDLLLVMLKRTPLHLDISYQRACPLCLPSPSPRTLDCMGRDVALFLSFVRMEIKHKKSCRSSALLSVLCIQIRQNTDRLLLKQS